MLRSVEAALWIDCRSAVGHLTGGL